MAYWVCSQYYALIYEWLIKTYLTTKLICHEEVQHDNLQTWKQTKPFREKDNNIRLQLIVYEPKWSVTTL